MYGYQMKSLSSWSACNFSRMHLILIHETMPPLEGWSKLSTAHTYTVYYTIELENVITILWKVEGVTSVNIWGGPWISIVNWKTCWRPSKTLYSLTWAGLVSVRYLHIGHYNVGNLRTFLGSTGKLGTVQAVEMLNKDDGPNGTWEVLVLS